MQTINISEKKFKDLKLIELSKHVTNTEAFIYSVQFNPKQKPKIFKKLHRLKGTVFANKLYTIEMLDNYRELLPESFVIPYSLCSVKKNVDGFLEDYVTGENLADYLRDRTVDLENKKYYIQKIGGILNQLKQIRKNTSLKNIYINDLHAGNFIVTKNNDLKVIDLDSCKICDNKPFPSKYLNKKALLNYSKKYDVNEIDEDDDDYDYKKELGYVNANENSDLYCYIITILNFLYRDNVNEMKKEDFEEYLNYLEYIKLNKNLLDSFSRIITDADNINPKEYISSITYEQYGKANNYVYKLNQNRKM